MTALTESEKGTLSEAEERAESSILIGNTVQLKDGEEHPHLFRAYKSAKDVVTLLAIVRRLDEKLVRIQETGIEALKFELTQARKEAEIIRNVFCPERELPWETPAAKEGE